MTTSPTAAFLAKAIETSPLTQREIAKAAGFPKPNMISMMKAGQAKIPIDRIPELAKALDVSRSDFLRIAMVEYHPEIWDVITITIGEPLSTEEYFLVSVFRDNQKHGEIEIEPAVDKLLAEIFSFISAYQSGAT